MLTAPWGWEHRWLLARGRTVGSGQRLIAGFVVFGVAVLTIASAAGAQVADTIDLAGASDQGSVRVGQRDYLRIVLKNAAPRSTYTFKTAFDEHPIPPFPSTAFATLGMPHLPAPGTHCGAVALAEELDALGEESAVAAKLRQLDTQGISDCVPIDTDSISAIRAKTYRSYAVGKLGNADLTLTITRHGPASLGKDSVKTWTRKYTTPNESPWLVTYGFAFNNSKDQRYFSKSLDSSHFQIVERRKERDYDITPSVQFTYLLPFDRMEPLDIGLTGGLGASKDKFAILVGPSIGIGHNLWATAGVVGHSRRVLNTQYKGGGADTVKTLLDDTQLHESKNDWFGFVSLSFRFESNPFGDSGSKGKDSTAVTPKAPETPKKP